MFSALRSICFIHHFEHLGDRINLFDSYWLIVISFSTVGYGDIYPTHWTGKLVITFFIGAALVFLPPKVCFSSQSFSLLSDFPPRVMAFLVCTHDRLKSFGTLSIFTGSTTPRIAGRSTASTSS